MRFRGRHIPLGALVGFLVIAINVLAAISAPLIAPHGQQDLVGDVWAPPSAEFWLGLDSLGRDMLSRILFGARLTIGIAFLITVCAFAIGISAGFTAAVAGGWLDSLLSRVVDATMAIPTLILALVVLSALGTSLPTLVGIIAVLESTRVFRLCRAVGIEIALADFVEAARLRGEGLVWLVFREVLPNALSPLVTEFGLRFCFAFLFIAALSFIGLGIQPPLADWGGMVRDNAQAVNFGSLAPLIPAAAIAQLTIGVNLVIDWVISRRGINHGAGA